MALYLGRAGRILLRTAIASPRLNRLADSFGEYVHRKIPSYTPGLTRESYLLWQKTKPGDIVQVKADGFYQNEQKLCGNAHISDFIRGKGVHEIPIDKDFFPEYFTCEKSLSLPRYLTQAALSYDAIQNIIDDIRSIGHLSTVTLAAQLLLHSALGLPIYLLARPFRGDKTPEQKYYVWQMESLLRRKTIVTYENMPQKAFVRPFHPNLIFIHPAYRSKPTVIHENGHLHGASENAACDLSGRTVVRQLFYQELKRADLFKGVLGLLTGTLDTFFWFVYRNLNLLFYGQMFFFRVPPFLHRLEKIDHEGSLRDIDDQDMEQLCDAFILARAQSKNDLAVKIARLIQAHEDFADNSDPEPKSAFLFEYGQALEEMGEKKQAGKIYRSILKLKANDLYREMVREKLGLLSSRT